VPLLHGVVVVSAHDHFGAPTELSEDHLKTLGSDDITRRMEWVLQRRVARAERDRRRRSAQRV
jgi:uncharacterized small protein (DUF1192 family)